MGLWASRPSEDDPNRAGIQLQLVVSALLKAVKDFNSQGAERDPAEWGSS